MEPPFSLLCIWCSYLEPLIPQTLFMAVGIMEIITIILRDVIIHDPHVPSIRHWPKIFKAWFHLLLLTLQTLQIIKFGATHKISWLVSFITYLFPELTGSEALVLLAPLNNFLWWCIMRPSNAVCLSIPPLIPFTSLLLCRRSCLMTSQSTWTESASGACDLGSCMHSIITCVLGLV